ncbi:hypothetical protein PIB30_010192 [Stylosanthes scabra]|uniref:Uncharacterized protein n=1 Tax=Stylosanthes scabra TaxID=79078 RepID=A0ABU6R4E5_9FABA|nr:hypothetical protein [Stylosanthes scabra]
MASTSEKPPVDDSAESFSHLFVVPAFMELTRTMDNHTHTIQAATNVVQEHANNVGEMAVDMQN